MIKKILNRIAWIQKTMKDKQQMLLLRGEEVEVVREALEKADKYRWHDLRKNPDDLPEEDRECLVYHEYYHCYSKKILPEYETGRYAYGMWFGEASKGIDNNILAWRYIEPFEEVEE